MVFQVHSPEMEGLKQQANGKLLTGKQELLLLHLFFKGLAEARTRDAPAPSK